MQLVTIYEDQQCKRVAIIAHLVAVGGCLIITEWTLEVYLHQWVDGKLTQTQPRESEVVHFINKTYLWATFVWQLQLQDSSKRSQLHLASGNCKVREQPSPFKEWQIRKMTLEANILFPVFIETKMMSLFLIGCLSLEHTTMWTIEEPSITEMVEIWADNLSSSETLKCWHLMADVEHPSLLRCRDEISKLPVLVISINKERHDVIGNFTWWLIRWNKLLVLTAVILKLS